MISGGINASMSLLGEALLPVQPFWVYFFQLFFKNHSIASHDELLSVIFVFVYYCQSDIACCIHLKHFYVHKCQTDFLGV